jgi:hypothetical protein
MSVFCKRISCPSSQALLGFGHSRLGYQESVNIERHLRSCDFCNAELQLLTLHRHDPEEYTLAEMPAQLRRLAESLLRRSSVPFHPFTTVRVNHRTQ